MEYLSNQEIILMMGLFVSARKTYAWGRCTVFADAWVREF